MNKKAFTLTELIGVITILGLIAIIAFPPLLKQIKGTKGKIDEATETLITTGASNYINENKNDFPKINGNKYCIALQTLVDDNKVSKDLVDSEGNQLNLNKYVKVEVNKNSYSYSIADTCDGKYKEHILNGADPVLKIGMIPVKISADGTVKKADTDKAWYNYSKKEWANAVLVTNNSRNNYQNMKPGEVISESDILAYFVWIPRYRYRLWSVETERYLFDAESKVHSINIVFENNKTTKSNGTQNGQYLTHPAFTFGEEELNGIWVGKFETGYNGAEKTDDAKVSTADSSKAIIKPNVYAWRYIDVKNSFYTVKNMNSNNNIFGLSTDGDTHMMKNTEWGAVAYLSHSQYGTCTNGTCTTAYINNQNKYTTGCGYTDGAVGREYDDDDDDVDDGVDECQNQYGTNTYDVYNQSTTGNISGIFDMSGGAYEHLMGYATGAETQYGRSGFDSSTFPKDNKYIDLYDINDDKQYNKRILGDATGELGPIHYPSESDSNNYWTLWYGDHAKMIDSIKPWFMRGGYYASDDGAEGIFLFNDSTGEAANITSFRAVIS